MAQLWRMVLTYTAAFVAGGLVSWSVRSPEEATRAPAVEVFEPETRPPSAVEPRGSMSILATVHESEGKLLIGVIAPAERVDLVAGGPGRLETLNIALGDIVKRCAVSGDRLGGSGLQASRPGCTPS